VHPRAACTGAVRTERSTSVRPSSRALQPRRCRSSILSSARCTARRLPVLQGRRPLLHLLLPPLPLSPVRSSTRPLELELRALALALALASASMCPFPRLS
jgi:hypothetical protein